MKKNVTEQRKIFDKRDKYTWAETLARVSEAVNDLPIEHRASVQFTVDSETFAYDDAEYPGFFICWDRPETDEEEKLREEREATQVAWREKIERDNYERLKKKFDQQ